MNEQELLSVLQIHFGLERFRPCQQEAIESILSGHDTLVMLCTGAGKSLTFQFPPCATDTAAVIISPLLALAKDQVAQAQGKGIDARMWSSDTPETQKDNIVSELCSGDPSLRLLYTTPESLRQQSQGGRLRSAILEASKIGKICCFAIDEAHCVSEWGHDFRPAYLELASLKADFPGVPISCLTASCTAAVQNSIIATLGLKSPRVIKASFNRPNIKYEVRNKELIGDGSMEAVLDDLAELVSSRAEEGGIIYARTRSTCDWLYQQLSDRDLDVGAYHAGKDPAQRARIQREWSEGSIAVVVATIAFGMGIDRGDVRYVVHWNAPSSMEGLYQESGRVGRDGLPSVSIVYASKEDLESARRLERGCRIGSVSSVASYCFDPGCRRKKLLSYFGEHRGKCCHQEGDLPCDFCLNPKAILARMQQLEKVDEQRSVAAAIRAALAQRSSGHDDSERAAPSASWKMAVHLDTETNMQASRNQDPLRCSSDSPATKDSAWGDSCMSDAPKHTSSLRIDVGQYIAGSITQQSSGNAAQRQRPRTSTGSMPHTLVQTGEALSTVSRGEEMQDRQQRASEWKVENTIPATPLVQVPCLRRRGMRGGASAGFKLPRLAAVGSTMSLTSTPQTTFIVQKQEECRAEVHTAASCAKPNSCLETVEVLPLSADKSALSKHVAANAKKRPLNDSGIPLAAAATTPIQLCPPSYRDTTPHEPGCCHGVVSDQNRSGSLDGVTSSIGHSATLGRCGLEGKAGGPENFPILKTRSSIPVLRKNFKSPLMENGQHQAASNPN